MYLHVKYLIYHLPHISTLLRGIRISHKVLDLTSIDPFSAAEPFYLSWIYLTHLTLLDVGVILIFVLFFILFSPACPPVPSPRCGPYPIVLLALGVLR